jgi:solute carrier family 36 (proton-coupled amino acid transporter)
LTKYGEANRDDSYLDEEDAAYIEGLDATPRTKRNIIRDEKMSDIKKLGPWATAFTLFKGFVATGILYMPKNFVNGGWLFSAIALFMALFVTLLCIRLLLEVRNKVGGSFSDIGAKTYGKCGKVMVDITLFGS